MTWLIEFSERGGPWKLLHYDGPYPNRRSARRGVALLRVREGKHYCFRPAPYVRRPK